jgi:hypothetical protein
VRYDFDRLDSWRVPDFHCRVDVEAYRENLRAIARLCEDGGIPCIFLNLIEVPTVTRAFRRCEQCRSEGRYADSLNAIIPACELHGGAAEEWFEALAIYQTGLTMEAAGEKDKARECFERSAQAASLWKVMSGGILVRHAEEYLQIAREVAAEFGVPCVETKPDFAERPDLFADYFQVTAEGHRLIAQALAKSILEKV